jgi:hypothetical protein
MTPTCLAENLTIIEKRWPKLHQHIINAHHQAVSVETIENTITINAIQLTSNYDRIAEAKLQLTRIPKSSEKAFIYGVGLGDTAELALQRTALKQLHVIILNPAIFLHIINVKKHNLWLEDKRTNLHLVDKIKDVYKPFLANPAELILADNNSAQLRDRISVELNNDFIQHKYLENDGGIKSSILNNLDYVKKDKSLSQLSLHVPKQIFIAAARPTLEEHLQWLKENSPFIICLDAALTTLLASNIIPDIIISIDKRVFHLFKDIQKDKLKDIPLVYFPYVERSLLDYWPGERFCSYSKTNMYKDITLLKEKVALFSSGSVIHPAIDLAVYLKASEVILLGADFSFPNNKGHATPDGSNKSELDVESAKHWLFNGLGEKVTTMANFKGYLRDLERYIALNPTINFYTGSLLSAKIDGVNLWTK